MQRYSRLAYSPHLWYAQAKMCQLLLVAYLTSRTRLHLNAVHPGVVESPLYKYVVLRSILGPFYMMVCVSMQKRYVLLSELLSSFSVIRHTVFSPFLVPQTYSVYVRSVGHSL